MGAKPSVLFGAPKINVVIVKGNITSLAFSCDSLDLNPDSSGTQRCNNYVYRNTILFK